MVLRNIDKMYEIVEPRIQNVERRRKDDDHFKTLDEVFDRQTLMTIYKLICDKVIFQLDFPVATGKEANVFKGTGRSGDIAVKIYRISTLNFKAITRYIEGDERFRVVKNKRQMMYTWAQKEYKNLLRAESARVRAPQPIAQHRNAVVMKYIGTKSGPAKMLKDVDVEDAERCFWKLIEMVRRLYVKGELVHCDISEYNILWYRKTPVLIDWAQAVPTTHPHAIEWLRRDVHNLLRYFSRLGVRVSGDEAERAVMEG